MVRSVAHPAEWNARRAVSAAELPVTAAWNANKVSYAINREARSPFTSVCRAIALVGPVGAVGRSVAPPTLRQAPVLRFTPLYEMYNQLECNLFSNNLLELVIATNSRTGRFVVALTAVDLSVAEPTLGDAGVVPRTPVLAVEALAFGSCKFQK